MLQSLRYVQRLSRRVMLTASVLLLSLSPTFARGVSNPQSQETRADAGKPASNPPDLRRLEIGKPIEREMRGGQSHTYQIALDAGQYLYVVVEQRGIDVAVQVIAPDGKPLMEVDSPNGAQGDEPVMLIAEAAGIYRLTVVSLEEAVPAGKYEIRVRELRAATATDRTLIEKNRVLQEASQLSQEVGQLYGAGKYDAALPLAERALAINEKALGAGHPDTAEPLNNLALLYQAKGDYAKAEAFLIRALAINEKALGAEHPDTATSLNNLAALYNAKGDYAKAEPLYVRALAIREKALGPEHPSTSQSLSNLALLYQSKGELAKAEPLYLRALAIREKALGAEHPDTAETLNHLALLYRARGDYAKAVAYQSRCNDVSDRDLVRNLATGSERQKFIYLAQTSLYTDSTISLHTQSAPDDPEAKRATLKLLLQRKGRALDAMTDAIAALRRRVSPEDQVLLNQLQDVRSQLSVLTLRGPGREEAGKHRATLKALEEQEEKLQNDISQRSAEFRAQSQTQSQPVTIAAIQKALPPGAALIEFAQYRPVDPNEPDREKRFGSPQYVAYVLPSQGEPLWVKLGEAKPIDDAINAWRAVLRKDEDQPLSQIDRQVKPAARKVDERVMQPVRRLLGHTRQVFISPDGLLNLIAFAALVDEKDRYLVKRYHFTSLTSGRDLLRLQEHLPSKQGMVIVANPDYGPMSGAAAGRGLKSLKPQIVEKGNAAATSDGAASEIAFSQVEFPQLAGTEQESLALKALLPEATTMLRLQATKTAVKQVNAPSILHIATHGYFLEDLVTGSARDERGLSVGGQPNAPATRIENPLLRAGLALAGANLRRSDYEGILTALEVSGLNLWGTKLVVLSACETGVGEVQNFNGVAGLRRALVLAGSESQMLSLWKVDDTATRDLMIGYYTRLKAGIGRSEALRQVQLKMLASSRYQHPYFWASFVESGEWANLDGKR